VDGTLAIIGTGRMGEALLRGLLRTDTVSADQVVCTDVREDRCREIQDTYGVRAHADNRAAVADADVVLVALKPQVLLDEIRAVSDAMNPRQVVISIAAGLPTRALEGVVPAETAVVRVMPNTPAMVDQGMSLIAPGLHAGEAELALAERLLGAVGEVLRLPEAHLDAATALSGSGPAYVFLLAEAMIDAGVGMGLSREVSTRLATQTIRGSGTLLHQSGEHPGRLREDVTSPGGTTAAALHRFEAAGVRAVVAEAAEAARARAQELGGG
jgi:pyrroline-5-carboxylate reductase